MVFTLFLCAAVRCDSAETARLLLDQLTILVDRPENQKKFLEIENRLQEGDQSPYFYMPLNVAVVCRKMLKNVT